MDALAPRVVVLAFTLAFGLVPVGARAQIPPLFVDCRGAATAAPTVILESGAFGTSADWDFVLDDVARGGRACAYDRAGLGGSPPRAGGEDPIAIAGELDNLLDSLGETRPVILVGHSNGALYVEAFAALHPERVAGLVYVNGVTSNDLSDPRLVASLVSERHAADLAVIAAEAGLAQVIASKLVADEGLTGDAAERKRSALTRLQSLRVARDEDRTIAPGLAAVGALGGPPPAIPIAVLVSEYRAGDAMTAAWSTAEIAAANGHRSWILEAPGATHVSPLSRDRAWLIAAVAWLRSLAASREPAQPEPKITPPVAGP